MKKLTSLFSRFLRSKNSKNDKDKGYVIKAVGPLGIPGIDFYYIEKLPRRGSRMATRRNGLWTEDIDEATHYSEYPRFNWLWEGFIVCKHYI
jgi:hypothetical protein